MTHVILDLIDVGVRLQAVLAGAGRDDPAAALAAAVAFSGHPDEHSLILREALILSRSHWQGAVPDDLQREVSAVLASAKRRSAE